MWPNPHFPLNLVTFTGKIHFSVQCIDRFELELSYSKFFEFNTTFCKTKVSRSRITRYNSAKTQSNERPILAYDNIDRLEETFNGPGTSHRVNKIAIQRVFIEPLLNPFHATDLFRYPPENIRKPLVFWCFQGASEDTRGMKWVKVIIELI